MIRNTKIFLIVLVLLAGSCVEPYKIKIPGNTKYLVVEATLNDTDSGQVVIINETNNFLENIYNSPVSKLKVEIIVNEQEIIHLIEQKSGIYALPLEFRIQPENTYRLRFTKPDGTIYESSDEKTTKVPPIERIFDEFKVDGIEGTNRDIPANYVFVDFKDNPETTDFYLWTWKLWENQNICLTDYYDYPCNSKCWEILSNKDFNLFSDVYSNGKQINGRLIAKIPFYSLDGALIEIRQQAVSERAYKYFRLMSEQQQTNGSLVDTPPAALIGNIKNLSNSEEPVTGIFTVTSNVRKKYWLSRENGHGKASPVGLLGRIPNIPSVFYPVPCIEGPTRTPTKPDGWIN